MITGKIYVTKNARGSSGQVYEAYTVHAYVKKSVAEKFKNEPMVIVPMSLFERIIRLVDELNTMLKSGNIEVKQFTLKVKELYNTLDIILSL